MSDQEDRLSSIHPSSEVEYAALPFGQSPPANDLMMRRATDAVALRVGLVDCHRFSQEALARAFDGMDPRLCILPFATMEACIAHRPRSLDVVIYHAHTARAGDSTVSRDLSTCRESLGGVPIIVMSDAEGQHQAEALRSAFRNGARGFIPARSTGIPLTLAVIIFVNAGGLYGPIDLLLGDQLEGSAPEAPPKGQFTSRQISVLTHLKQGKANKTIAHELGMSESTVKVHVRNIMRAMGATNRTQAAYLAQQVLSGLNSG